MKMVFILSKPLGWLAGAAVGLGVLLGAAPAGATGRTFAYTYETGVLNPGDAELEPWTTWRTGREEFFNRYDLRLELELGLVENLQAAVYWNWRSQTADVADDTGALSRVSSHQWKGASIELKYKLSDPVVDPLGSALYFEVTHAPAALELEGKLLLDKRLGAWTLGLNLVGEYEAEFEREGAEELTHKEIEAVVVGGVAYHVSDPVSLGLEARSVTVFEEESEPSGEKAFEAESSTLQVGPVVSWRRGTWWLASTFLAQVAAPKGATAGGLDLEHGTRWETRLLMGFHL